ncbi:MAG: thiamine phosphate synthase [Motiliproteus sp.]
MNNKPKPTLSGLYAITDAGLMPGSLLEQKVTAALSGGAQVIQYRDKSDNQSQRLQQAKALVALCNQFQRPLLINDDIALAKQANAHGVHLGQKDGSIAEARKQLGEQAIIGVTCHDSLQLALDAQKQGADYAAFGAFFASSTKPDAKAAPIQLLHDAHQLLRIPIVAIGGITVDNALQVIEPGASMVAVIHSLFACDDIETRALQFSRLFAPADNP